jgi:hypothetical protein
VTLPSPRAVRRRYRDPLDIIWSTTARRIGLTIRRSKEAFAATDGRGELVLGAPETLDADDCLAQMVFHELCHALVEGPEALERPDWGLDNVGLDDLSREHACLRVQRWLAGGHGLEEVLAPTTDHRAFYDALGDHPLDPQGVGSGMEPARAALRWVARDPFGPHLERALAATAEVLRSAAPFREGADLLDAPTGPTRHPTGLRLGARGRCGDCAWRHGRRSMCRQARRVVEADWPGCARYEPEHLDCQDCGACCREAYQAVELGRREAARLPPRLVERVDGRLRLRRVPQRPRAGDRCAALEGQRRFACVVYDERPRTCRDFTRRSAHCLDARRRVGLSL